MQIIFLPSPLAIALCFIVWPILQFSASLFCLSLPDRFYSPDSFFFRSRSFEREGLLYDKVFRVGKWKHRLPDGGMFWKKRGFRKKNLENFTDENLHRFLIESARAELIHWLSILPFWIFGFFAPPKVIGYMLIYALLANLPCIIAQRYNRPRILRLLNKRKDQGRDRSWIMM